MRNLLASPRRRRRLARGGVAALVVVSAVAAIALFSDSTRPPAETLRPAAAQPVAREIPLTAAMRKGINRTLEEFVPAAVGRKDASGAWRLAGPGLRAGGTLRAWKAGEMPVHPYPFADKACGTGRSSTRAATAWRSISCSFPRRAREGPVAFGIDLVPGRRDGWSTRSSPAIWSGKGERPFVTGPQDFTGKFGTKQSTYDKPKLPEARLSAVWILVPGVVLGASIVAPLSILLWGLAKRRTGPAEPLPPLPSTVARRQ